MRRLHKYCLKRGQVKLSWNPGNCYNIFKWHPLNEKNLNIFQIEWKSKTQCRLFFNGDVTDNVFKRTYSRNHRNMNSTLQSMDKRIDNVIFRSMLSSSVFAARKMISSGNIFVNGRRVNYPDSRLEVGDLLQVDPNSSENTRSLISHPFIRLWAFIPSYLDVSFSSLSVALIREPTITEIPHPFTKNMLSNFAAFYSKR